MQEKIMTWFTAITLLIAAAVLYAIPVAILWNKCLASTVDGIHEIGFWKALGISILIKLLAPVQSNQTK